MIIDLTDDDADLLADLLERECARLAALPRPDRVAARYGDFRALRRQLVNTRLGHHMLAT